ncbi:MAG: heavy-metal-associated domain-containing protein [Clostridiales Family XIII bacterium]|nr:heavy-metal-associated domain-containing protein [Clostridiales Family XIII bacterium]
MAVTKTYFLENLCCEKCAAAIERDVRALAGVQSAEVDFSSTSIAVVFDADPEAIFKSVASIASEIDEDIVTKEI